ncbi:MAG: LapA family protein [Candidatus Aminicenantes bacterium]|nr:LapA family protein [Candidatus Aminicenantes bacterium]
MKWKWIVIAVIFALMVVLLLQNRQVVVYRLFFWKVAMSQVILVPVLAVLGFVAGFVTAMLVIKRSGKKAGGNLKPEDKS